MGQPTTRLRLRVVPGAARTELAGRYGDAWKIRVAAPPERGKANAAVLALLSERLHLPHTELDLVSGLSSRDKVVELHGLDEAEAARRLEERP